MHLLVLGLGVVRESALALVALDVAPAFLQTLETAADLDLLLASAPRLWPRFLFGLSGLSRRDRGNAEGRPEILKIFLANLFVLEGAIFASRALRFKTTHLAIVKVARARRLVTG